MNSMVRTLLIFGALVFICVVLLFVVRPAINKSRALSSLGQDGRAQYDAWATTPLGVKAGDLSVTLPGAEFETEKKALFEAWNNIAVTVNENQKTITTITDRKAVIDTDDVAFLATLEPYFKQLGVVVNHPDYSLEDLNLYNAQSEAALQTLPVIQLTRNLLFVRGLYGLAKSNEADVISSGELLIKLAKNPPYATAFVDALSWSILERASGLARIVINQPKPLTRWPELRAQFLPVIEHLKSTDALDATAVDHLGMVRMMLKTKQLSATPALTDSTTGEELFRIVVQKPDATDLQAASSYAITYKGMVSLKEDKDSLLSELEYIVTK